MFEFQIPYGLEQRAVQFTFLQPLTVHWFTLILAGTW